MVFKPTNITGGYHHPRDLGEVPISSRNFPRFDQFSPSGARGHGWTQGAIFFVANLRLATGNVVMAMSISGS